MSSYGDSTVHNRDKLLDAIVKMREFGILEQGMRPDGEVIPSEDLIGNFINELKFEEQYELKWRYLRNEDIEPKSRETMVLAMVNALGKMAPVDSDVKPFNVAMQKKKNDLLVYLFIISLCKPFNHVLFLEGDGR